MGWGRVAQSGTKISTGEKRNYIIKFKKNHAAQRIITGCAKAAGEAGVQGEKGEGGPKEIENAVAVGSIARAEADGQL